MTESRELSASEPIKADKNAETRQHAVGRVSVVLRVLSAITLVLAIFAATSIVILRLIHFFQPDLAPWNLKSAIPLVLIGVAFASMQFILPRKRVEILLGLMVAAAFILWGVEQFVSSPAMVSLIDDMVVFMFVVDLSIVIYSHLKLGRHPVVKQLPFDESGP